MELPTRSLVLRVCQFRHDRVNVLYYISTFPLCQLIFHCFLKKSKNIFYAHFFKNHDICVKFFSIFLNVLQTENKYAILKPMYRRFVMKKLSLNGIWKMVGNGYAVNGTVPGSVYSFLYLDNHLLPDPLFP